MPRDKRALALMICLIVLNAAGCHDPDDFIVTKERADELITLRVIGGQTSLPADGFSKLTFRASIDPRAASGRRTIVFSTDRGTLKVGDTSGADVEVEADGAGTAVADLQSSQEAGNASVTAAVKGVAGVATTVVIAFTVANPDDVVRFTVAPATAPADDETRTVFTVATAPNLPESNRSVTFATTVGRFAPNNGSSIEVMIDANDMASAELISPDSISSGQVSATVMNVTRTTVISFERALPNRITVTTQKLQVQATNSDSTVITATLERDVGMVTQGTTVLFSAPVGTFFNQTTTDASGRATATFVPGSTAMLGLTTITVTEPISGVSGTTQVEIIAPG